MTSKIQEGGEKKAWKTEKLERNRVHPPKRRRQVPFKSLGSRSAAAVCGERRCTRDD